MNKEFITYEQAVALKELGFDEWCFGGYDKGYGVLLVGYDTNVGEHFDRDFYIHAPLKQQAFRFFREKYNQNSFIELVYRDGMKYDYVLYADKDEKECENFGDGPFDTPEEAENACIDKLIEIVKQQDNG
jgi:hypothetical protein